MKVQNILDINFASITKEALIPYLRKCIDENLIIHLHTVNVDHLVIGHKDENFKNIMKNANIVVADGMPIVWYSRLIRRSLPERVTGVDLCELICKKSKKMEFKIYLLGAKKGVGERAKKKLEIKYPGVQIMGVYSPDKYELNNERDSKEIVKVINASGANILLVAFGAPKQEIWISKYKPLLKTNINIGVGATVDFMAGEVKRAPKKIQNIGLEWLYRMLKDPKRLFKRYIINDSYFILMCLKSLNLVCKRR